MLVGGTNLNIAIKYFVDKSIKFSPFFDILSENTLQVCN